MAEFDAKGALNQMEPVEQLKYYKKRLADVNVDYFKLLDIIEKLKEDSVVNEYYRHKISSIYDEVHGLRRSVSDLQIQVLQEREKYLKLLVENEQLKTDLGLCRRLAELGETVVEMDTVWAKTRPELRTVQNESAFITEQKSKIRSQLMETLEDLNVQIGNVSLKTVSINNLYAAEIACLIKDRDSTEQNFNSDRDALKSQINVLQESVRKMTALNLGNLSDVASVKAECLQKETAWQKDFNAMLTHLQLCKDLMGDRFPRFPENSCPAAAAAAMNVEDATAHKSQTEDTLQLQLNQKNSLITKYHRKCVELQKETEQLSNTKSKLRQETMAKVGKLLEKIKFLKKNCEDQKHRRKLDAEGFYSEFHILKSEVEKCKKEMAGAHSRVSHKKEEKTLLGKNIKSKK